ncbi:hypothetical protein C8R48DRAFT_768862 [Suillus tomentosus]|nr:hypothetical protein C8R48DRAFT_768862 [Suillus tomentosus]
MSENPNPGPLRGASGKSTDTFSSTNNCVLTDSEINWVVETVGKHMTDSLDLEDLEAVVAENSVHSARNAVRESKQNNPDFIEDVSEDESLYDEPSPSTPLPKPFPGNKIMRAFSFLNSLTLNTARRVVGVETTILRGTNDAPDSIYKKL